jgi:hypothetical protein
MQCRFSAPTPGSHSGKRVLMVREIERQANEAWRATPCEVPGIQANTAQEYKAVAAYDFLTVHIPHEVNDQSGSGAINNTQPTCSHPQKRKWKAHSNDTR